MMNGKKKSETFKNRLAAVIILFVTDEIFENNSVIKTKRIGDVQHYQERSGFNW